MAGMNISGGQFPTGAQPQNPALSGGTLPGQQYMSVSSIPVSGQYTAGPAQYSMPGPPAVNTSVSPAYQQHGPVHAGAVPMSSQGIPSNVGPPRSQYGAGGIPTANASGPIGPYGGPQPGAPPTSQYGIPPAVSQQGSRAPPTSQYGIPPQMSSAPVPSTQYGVPPQTSQPYSGPSPPTQYGISPQTSQPYTGQNQPSQYGLPPGVSQANSIPQSGPMSGPSQYGGQPQMYAQQPGQPSTQPGMSQPGFSMGMPAGEQPQMLGGGVGMAQPGAPGVFPTGGPQQQQPGTESKQACMKYLYISG